MAKRLFAAYNVAYVAQAIGSIITNANSYMALRAPGANQLVDILEVLITGTAVSSTIGAFMLDRASTNSASETPLSAPNADGGQFPGISAIATNPIVAAITAGTQPIPSSATTDARLNLSLNTFGGILRWNAAPFQQYQMLGNTAPGAECVLLNSTASGGQNTTANAHIMYEPY